MRIAITGAGIVSAIGNDKASVLQRLRDGETGIGAMRFLHSTHTELPVGEVKLSDDELKAKAGIDAGKTVSRTALLGLEAARQAIDEAGLHTGVKVDDIPQRIVFISGTTVAGMDITERYFDEATDGGCGDCSFIRQHECGSNTQTIANYFGLFEASTTISTACSSAANAIALGARMIEMGEADIAVAGGTEALSRFHLDGFNSLMILDHGLCRPFDATRAGLNLGEGAGYVVLEKADTAERRGAKTLAYLTGYGNACDAFHQTASSDNGEGAYLAMKEALATAGLAPSDIQYINAHGTGTPSNDKSESAAIRRVFGDKIPPTSSTKWATGHTTSASGGIETVISILAIQYNLIPGNTGWRNADEQCITPTVHTTEAKVDNVMCNSFGFGGNDTSLIISRNATEHKPKEKVYSCHEAARVVIDSEDALGEIREYATQMEARRMGKLAKGAMISSRKALAAAGIDVPDAIITATRFGCLANTERMLMQVKTSGEETVSPTDFMQSTHNTIGSAIAIKLKCHGYNSTYSHGTMSLDWAIRDAKMLIESGQCRSVLVGLHDEMPEAFGSIFARAGEENLPRLRSEAIVVTVSS